MFIFRWLFLLIKFVVRFAIGHPMLGPNKTDASFWSPGTTLLREQSWWHFNPTRWSYLPGWKRAAIRWACVLFVVAWLKSVWLGVGLTALVATLAGFRVRRWWQRRRHVRNVVQPIWAGLERHLRLKNERYDNWLSIPMDYATNDSASVKLNLPASLDATERVQDAIDNLITQRLGGYWEPTWNLAQYNVVYRPAAPPGLPSYLEYTDEPDDPATTIKVGQAEGYVDEKVDMKRETPNWFVTAAPGGGKTSLLNIAIGHARSKGMLVDVIDLKQQSFTDSMVGVPGVRVHTTIEGAVGALWDFYLSMYGVNQAVARGEDLDDYPQRLLVFDEFGTFAVLAPKFWKSQGNKGQAPYMDAFLLCGYQGRAANHRMIVAVHQPNSKVFGGSDLRDLFGVRIAMGPMTRNKYTMAFGSGHYVQYDSEVVGRGLLAYGEDEPHIIQLAHLKPGAARALALKGSTPPDWFVREVLPPWVNRAMMLKAQADLGMKR